jgi:hypothetical protein
MMAKHKVVIGPVEHDGVVYQDGDDLSLTEDAAASLLMLGIIEVVEGRRSKVSADAD